MPRHAETYVRLGVYQQSSPGLAFFFLGPLRSVRDFIAIHQTAQLKQQQLSQTVHSTHCFGVFLHWRFMTCNIGLIENWVPQPRMVCIPSYVPIKVRILRDILHFRTNSYHIFWYFFLIYYIAIYCHILPYITIYYHILPYITIYYHQSISFL